MTVTERKGAALAAETATTPPPNTIAATDTIAAIRAFALRTARCAPACLNSFNPAPLDTRTRRKREWSERSPRSVVPGPSLNRIRWWASVVTYLRRLWVSYYIRHSGWSVRTIPKRATMSGVWAVRAVLAETRRLNIVVAKDKRQVKSPGRSFELRTPAMAATRTLPTGRAGRCSVKTCNDLRATGHHQPRPTHTESTTAGAHARLAADVDQELGGLSRTTLRVRPTWSTGTLSDESRASATSDRRARVGGRQWVYERVLQPRGVVGHGGRPEVSARSPSRWLGLRGATCPVSGLGRHMRRQPTFVPRGRRRRAGAPRGRGVRRRRRGRGTSSPASTNRPPPANRMLPRSGFPRSVDREAATTTTSGPSSLLGGGGPLSVGSVAGGSPLRWDLVPRARYPGRAPRPGVHHATIIRCGGLGPGGRCRR